jgi:3-oxoacyl-[acyl-carrier-protein] synthase II
MSTAALSKPVSLAGKTADRRVPIITGTALLTPLGETAQETWGALLAGRFITDHTRAAGEFDCCSPRIIQMAQRVARAAMIEAGWSADDDFATVVGTSKGSIESWFGPARQTGRLAPITGLGDIATHLATGYGPKLTLCGACASGLMALIRAAMLIESGQAERVLVVAAEASVHPLFLASFKRLGILARPEIGCRPFDQFRDGFLMSECAAAVCLEADLGCERPRNKFRGRSETRYPSAVVRIEHYALGGDACHLTSPDPSGRVLRHLINKVIQNQSIDLIHAHGTGTRSGDPIELAAIESALNRADRVPPPCLYSHKAALGHSLGAAGLVAVVLSHLSHLRGVIPGNVKTTKPLATGPLVLSTSPIHRPVHRSLVTAAGFGGATAAMTLSST